MLLEVGIDLTIGTVDIERCHWIIEVLDELRIRKEAHRVHNGSFKQEDLVKKVYNKDIER